VIKPSAGRLKVTLNVVINDEDGEIKKEREGVDRAWKIRSVK
jgi:hypothetical protein